MENLRDKYELDQEAEELDDSGPNFAQSEIIDTEDQEREEKRITPVLLLFKILSNPVEGWKLLRRGMYTPHEIEHKCLLPLCVLLGLSSASAFFYDKRTTVSSVVFEAADGFVSIFFSYFIILILIKVFTPVKERKRVEGNFVKEYIGMSLSTLCVFFSVINIFPMLWAVLIFLPIWTVYAMCSGIRFFRFPSKLLTRQTIVICLVTLGVPLGIHALFQEVFEL